MSFTISNKELVYQHIADLLAKIKPDLAIAAERELFSSKKQKYNPTQRIQYINY